MAQRQGTLAERGIRNLDMSIGSGTESRSVFLLPIDQRHCFDESSQSTDIEWLAENRAFGLGE